MKLITYLVLAMLISGCNPQATSIEEQVSTASCEANQVCRFANGVQVWLSEPLLSPETPFSVHVSLPDEVTIDSAKLVGVTMYMGFIPLQFTPFQDHFIAHTMVGICSERNMTWQLQLGVNDRQGATETLLYNFDVVY